MNLVNYLFAGKENSNKDYIFSKQEQVKYCTAYSNIRKVISILGIARQKRICIISENSSFFVHAYFGVIGSGNISVPLNAKLAGDELDKMIKIIQPHAIFIEKKARESLNIDVNCEIYSEDSIEKSAEGEIENNISEEDELASIMFTSGSSGKPKGVMITHKNIIANTDSIIEYLDLKELDRMEVVLPFHYCYGLSLLHTHTKAGGSIVLNNSFINPNSVIQDIKKHGCTGFAGVPSHFEILLKTTNFLSESFPTLRYITQAGGKMRNETILKIFESLKDTRLFIMYGQTEATARLSYLPPECLPAKLGSIGKGMPSVKLKVVRKDGTEARKGEIGELVASGENIMRGYFNDETATKSKIKERYLYTGDLATEDNEGFIYLAGREDDLVKVGGHRVSLIEINEELKITEGISDCYVAAREDKLFGNEIIALVVLAKGFKKEEVITRISKKLANPKLPSRFIEVDRIPLTPAGKISKESVQKIIQNERPS